MIFFNDRLMLKKITSETTSDVDSAKTQIINLKKIDGRLQEPVDRWMVNKNPESFSYKGIALATIMFRLQTDFIGALHYMDRLMNDPNELSSFKQELNTPLFLD